MKRALRTVIGIIAILTCTGAAAPVTGQEASPPSNPYNIDLTKTDVPHATFDERRFPLENPSEVSMVQYVNNYVNTHMVYVSDKVHYGFDDMWVMAPADKEGDCEDFAMTKLFMIEQNSLGDVKNIRLELVLIRTKLSNGKVSTAGHAILAYRLAHGSVVYLDNMTDHLMTKWELQKAGYEFQNW